MSIDDELTSSERAALAAERHAEAPDPRMQERMLRRLQLAIAVGGDAPSEHGAGAPRAAGAGRAGTRAITTRTVAAAAIGALVGAGITAFATRGADRADRQEVPGAASAAAPSPEDAGSGAPTSIAPTEAPSSAPIAAGSMPPAPRPRAPTSSSTDTLGAETNLLDAARTALGRGDGEAALRVLGDHARRFPASGLREEREALVVPALILAHRPAEAAAKAKSFRERFPKSIFLPSVDAALREKE